jgi:hypothetical protein
VLTELELLLLLMLLLLLELLELSLDDVLKLDPVPKDRVVSADWEVVPETRVRMTALDGIAAPNSAATATAARPIIALRMKPPKTFTARTKRLANSTI